MHKFRELKVWQYSIELVTRIYEITEKFPVKERFVLSQQINKAAISVPSNIAEGAGRKSQKEFCYFLNIALASSYELETQMVIALNLKYINDSDYALIIEKVDEVQKMIYSLHRSVERKHAL